MPTRANCYTIYGDTQNACNVLHVVLEHNNLRELVCLKSSVVGKDFLYHLC